MEGKVITVGIDLVEREKQKEQSRKGTSLNLHPQPHVYKAEAVVRRPPSSLKKCFFLYGLKCEWVHSSIKKKINDVNSFSYSWQL